MEALNSLKFWRKAAGDSNVAISESHVISGIDYVINNSMPETEYYSDDDDDESFFELELNTTKNAKLVESPRDVFRNGRVFPLDSPLSKPQSPISLLKSGPKLKVFLLGFKKSKTEAENGLKSSVEEMPVLSRDNSLRSKLLRESLQDCSPKRSHKYLKLLKPLYSMASKRYNADVIKFPDSSPASSPSRISSFKNMGKSKSAVGISPSPVNPRDETLLHDGIQGAILHCKRSYNSPQKELSRCVSDPTHEKSVFRIRDSGLMKRTNV